MKYVSLFVTLSVSLSSMEETLGGRHRVLTRLYRAPHSALSLSAIAALYIFDLRCNGLIACEGAALGAFPEASGSVGIVTLVESVGVRRIRVSGIGRCLWAVSSSPREMMTQGTGNTLGRHRHSTTAPVATGGSAGGGL